jgi:hypothetical protein
MAVLNPGIKKPDDSNNISFKWSIQYV